MNLQTSIRSSHTHVQCFHSPWWRQKDCQCFVFVTSGTKMDVACNNWSFFCCFFWPPLASCDVSWHWPMGAQGTLPCTGVNTAKQKRNFFFFFFFSLLRTQDSQYHTHRFRHHHILVFGSQSLAPPSQRHAGRERRGPTWSLSCLVAAVYNRLIWHAESERGVTVNTMASKCLYERSWSRSEKSDRVALDLKYSS